MIGHLNFCAENRFHNCVAFRFGSRIPLSSTKAVVGHTLGAAGATDAALCWLALARSSAGRVELPPHVWDGERDEELPELHMVEAGESVAVDGPTYVMTNAFGFGGNNCSLILGAGLS